VEEEPCHIGRSGTTYERFFDILTVSAISVTDMCSVGRGEVCLDELEFRFNSRKNPFMFRDAMFKRLLAETLPLREANSGLVGVHKLFYREAGLRNETAQSTRFQFFPEWHCQRCAARTLHSYVRTLLAHNFVAKSLKRPHRLFAGANGQCNQF
jgi:hypothetical protein